MGIDHHNITPTSPVARNISEKKARVMPAVGIYRPPAARRLDAQEPPTVAVAAEKSRSKHRRPDIQVYVPRPKRASTGARSVASQDVLSQPLSDTRPSRRQSTNQTSADVTNSPQKCMEDQAHHICQEISTTAIEDNSSQDVCSNLLSNTNVESEIVECVVESILKDINSQCTDSMAIEENLLSQLLDNEKPLIRHSPVTTDNFNTTDIANESLSEDLKSDIPPDDILPFENTNTVTEQILLPLCADFGSQKMNSDVNTDIKETHVMKEHQDFTNENKIEMPENVECVKVVSVDSNTNEQSALENVCLVEILAKDRLEKCEDKEEEVCRIREDQNRKNRSIHRGNISYISDLLVISDTDTAQDITPQVVTNPADCLEKHFDDSKCKESESTKTESQTTSVRLNPDECTWDMMFDENGDCLDPHLMEELTNKVGEVSIKTPQSDYKQFVTREVLPRDEYSHVIEIYNFPAEFKTQDLINVFSAYRSRGFEIKWVDDTHALGVFSSSVVAEEVLETNHPFLKTRPLHEATAESRAKARRTSEFLQPYRARPETCPALARRMVTGALGVRLSTAKQEREAEKALLKVARDKKKLEARQKDEAWEGTLSSSTNSTGT